MQLPLVAAALGLALAVSCGPSYRPIQERVTTEAEYLKAEAAAINLQGEEIVAAEGFLVKAKATDNAKQAADFADLAAAYYRAALARHTLQSSVNALGAAETALKSSQEQVEKYSKVLASVNANAGKGE